MILSPKAEKKTAICLHCGRFSHRVHQSHGHLVKDLPMGNRQVILRGNPQQLKCNNCKKPFSEILIFLAKRQGFTNKYAVMITEQVIHSDVNNVAKNNGLTKVEVWSMVMFIAESIIPINVE
jgi:transposase